MAKAFNVRVWDVIVNAVIKPMPAVALVGLITFWLPSIAGAVAATVVYVALALLFLIEREDREVALMIIKGQRR